jgi:hypothetical protein
MKPSWSLSNRSVWLWCVALNWAWTQVIAWSRCNNCIYIYTLIQKRQPDANDGAALLLALSTLGHDRPEGSRLRPKIRYTGRQSYVHNFWGLRVSLHLIYYVVAGLLCAREISQHPIQDAGASVITHNHDEEETRHVISFDAVQMFTYR